MAETGAGADDVAANRELWTRANSEYADEHAVRAWAAADITWGIFNVPEQQLGVLGETACEISHKALPRKRPRHGGQERGDQPTTLSAAK